MTENEAIEKLHAYLECESRRAKIVSCNESCDDCELCYMQGTGAEHITSVKTAIKALEEVQQYRQIGKIGTCRNAVEICKAMIERGIDQDNIAEYIKFEDNLVQRGYDLKKLIEMMEEHKQYRQICTVEECLRNKDFLDFLADKMNPNDFETYLSMYNSSGEKQEDKRWEN